MPRRRTSSVHSISINRAPVMALWGAVVAEREGYDWDEAVTLGKAVSGMNAQSKGQRLGIYEPKPASAEKTNPDRPPEASDTYVELLGRRVPAARAQGRWRAVAGGKAMNSSGAEHYLERAFGDALPDVRRAMEELAASYSPDELGTIAYGLYEQFRPDIPPGTRGWGARGTLDLNRIRSLRGQRDPHDSGDKGRFKR